MKKILVLCFSAFLLLPSFTGTLDLSRVTIVCPESATPAEEKAAAELKQHLGLVAQARNGEQTIRLITDPELPPDGYRISFHNNDLEIRGGTNFGLLYGVYALLEEDIGYRWYEPGITVIPKLDESKITVRERSESPAFSVVRDPFSFAESDPDWALRNRVIRMMHNSLPPEFGKKILFPRPKGEFWMCHTTQYFCPPSLFPSHPEYFMIDVNGKRSKQQICPSNPEVEKMAVRKLTSTLDHAPEANYIALSLEDNENWCHCPECTRINQREGSNGAAFFALVNRVAHEISEKHPGVKLLVTAYYSTLVPPEHMQMADNVSILYADINRRRSDPVTRGANLNHLKTWCKIAGEIIIWDYQADFSNYYRYVPSLYAVAQNLSFYRTLPVIKGVAIQGAYQGPGGERQGLRAWVEAKLLWNPERDYRELIRDYVRGVYGPAAPPIEKFYLYLDDLERQGGAFEAKYAEIAARGRACFEQAEKLAEGNTELQKRVQAAELPVLFHEFDQLYALRYRSNVSPEKMRQARELLDQIIAIMKVNNYQRLGEGTGRRLSDLVKNRDVLNRTIPEIPGVTGAESIVIPAVDGMSCLGTKKISDEKASDGTAVRQQPVNAWSWQLSFVGKNIPQGKYRIRIRNRLEKTGEKVTCIYYGVYDSASGTSPRFRLTPDLLDHPDYRWHDLKTFTISPGSVLWMMIPTRDNDLIHYIDCVELVPEP